MCHHANELCHTNLLCISHHIKAPATKRRRDMESSRDGQRGKRKENNARVIYTSSEDEDPTEKVARLRKKVEIEEAKIRDMLSTNAGVSATSSHALGQQSQGTNLSGERALQGIKHEPDQDAKAHQIATIHPRLDVRNKAATRPQCMQE